MLHTCFCESLSCYSFFLKTIKVGIIGTPVWISADIYSGFQSQTWQPYSCLVGICIPCSLGFTSSVTPADFLATSVATKPFTSTYLSAGIGGAWNLLSHNCLTVWDQTIALPTELCPLSYWIYNLTITTSSCPGIGAIACIKPALIVLTEVVYPTNCIFTRVRNCIKYK